MTKCYLLQAVLKLIYFFCIASINREVPTNFPFNIKLNNLHHKFLKMSCVDILNILYISSTRPPQLKTQDVRKLWKTRNVIQLYIVHCPQCPHGTTKRYFSILNFLHLNSPFNFSMLKFVLSMNQFVV